MKCPFCGDPNTQVTDTRENDDGDVVRRRRRCVHCNRRFTTYERLELRLPHIVKRNGSRVEYSHAKLLASLELASRKRPVTTEALEAAVERIESRLAAVGETEINSAQVGDLVMKELKKLDKVAYIRYASVYRNFADVDEFSSLVREVQVEPKPRRRAPPPPGEIEHDLFDE
ncbi:MAG: transcriptional regulator NrdR [Azoarcus sp.]|jgi:transcriptional repressor NrdR|nr:transcriptional regulator NrdR [Azoarcus sp.]